MMMGYCITYDCVIIIQLGIIVECQTLKSQSENKKIAYKKLYLKLFQLETEKRNSFIRHTRKSQVSMN